MIIQSDLKLGQEIELVKEFLHSEALRHQGKLTWECFVDSDVDTDLLIPRSLIKTFAETALHPGLDLGGEKGRIEISVYKTDLGILAMITDNGIAPGNKQSTGQIQNERLTHLDTYIQLFNSKNPHSINYSILGRSQGYVGASGSRVLITIQDQ